MQTTSIHRSPFALAWLASSFLPAAAVAQNAGPDLAELPASVRAGITAASDELLFDEPVDGELWARGSSYKARFAADGVTFVPFLGSNAPQNFPLELRAHAATLGGEALDVETDGRPTRSGDVVRIDRGAFVEEYELATKSLEQRFVFDDLRGAGDLVVRIATSSELEGVDLGASLRFENDLGRVDYGEATAIDARGRRLELDSTLIDGVIELRVPASFVEQAALPLVIDPILDVHTVGSSTLQDVYSDVAFDRDTDRWCIVWTTIWSGTDYDAYARLATGDFQLLPNWITLDFTTESWTSPKVANNNFTDQFLVCASVEPASGLVEIRGRFVQSGAGTAGAPFPISPADGSFRYNADIGGDPYDASPASYFLVVWQRQTTWDDWDIEGRLVSHGGSLGSLIPIASGPLWHEYPTVSSSTGIDTGDGKSAWTVTWHYPFSIFDRDIYAAQVSWNGAILHPSFPVATSLLDETNAVASTILDPTAPGSPRPYVITFERGSGGERDLVAAVLEGSTLLESSNLVDDFPAAVRGRDQFQPSIDANGAQFLLAFAERDNPNSFATSDVFACDYFWDGATLAPCELRQPIAATAFAEWDPAVHSKASSGGAGREYFVSHTTDSTSSGADIGGALGSGCTAMVESVCHGDGGDAPCPCGNDGSEGHGCASALVPEGGQLGFTGSARVSGDDSELHAAFLPPNVACLFFQGTSLSVATPFGNGLRCVSGSTVRFALQQADATGSASYPNGGGDSLGVAGHLPALGGTRFYQAWYRDPSGTCGSTFNLTNALRAIWTP